MVRFVERDSKRAVAVNPDRVTFVRPAPGSGTMIGLGNDGQVIVEGDWARTISMLEAA